MKRRDPNRTCASNRIKQGKRIAQFCRIFIIIPVIFSKLRCGQLGFTGGKEWRSIPQYTTHWQLKSRLRHEKRKLELLLSILTLLSG